MNRSLKENYSFPFYPQVWKLEEWEKLGFKNKEDAEYWQGSSCGILCIKMAIESILGHQIDPISNIITKGLQLNAYSHEQGWSHEGLARLGRLYGVKAVATGGLNNSNLISSLEQGAVPVVSIKWAFLPDKSLKEKIFFWKRRGGHLALVIGYEPNEGFYVNHTSTDPDYNWENKLIPFEQFNKAFTGRAIILSPISE